MPTMDFFYSLFLLMIFYTMNLNYANESPMYGLVNLISDSGIIRNHNNDIFFSLYYQKQLKS